jgi:hypothetical protein
MEIQLQGHKNRTERAKQIWLQFKALLDSGSSVDEVLDKVRKTDGSKFTRSYFYLALKKLKNLNG